MCPKCNRVTTVAAGFKSVCVHCGAEIYIPPQERYHSPYFSCVTEDPTASRLLEEIKRRKPTPDEVVEIEFYIATGVIICEER